MDKRMDERMIVAVGKPYREEIIWHLACGQAVVFPSWMGGRVQVGFLTVGEAQAFVDAAQICACLEVAGDNLNCVAHGGGRVLSMPTMVMTTVGG